MLWNTKTIIFVKLWNASTRLFRISDPFLWNVYSGKLLWIMTIFIIAQTLSGYHLHRNPQIKVLFVLDSRSRFFLFASARVSCTGKNGPSVRKPIETVSPMIYAQSHLDFHLVDSLTSRGMKNLGVFSAISLSRCQRWRSFSLRIFWNRDLYRIQLFWYALYGINEFFVLLRQSRKVLITILFRSRESSCRQRPATRLRARNHRRKVSTFIFSPFVYVFKFLSFFDEFFICRNRFAKIYFFLIIEFDHFFWSLNFFDENKNEDDKNCSRIKQVTRLPIYVEEK